MFAVPVPAPSVIAAPDELGTAAATVEAIPFGTETAPSVAGGLPTENRPN